jgi:hypothetical protein
MEKRQFTLLVIIVLALAGCRTIEPLPPPPSPQVYRLSMPPSLIPAMQDKMEVCQQEFESSIVFVEVKPQLSLDFHNADIVIQLGDENLTGNEYPVQVGWAQLVLITHPDMNAASLDYKTIVDRYTASQNSGQIWTYPHDHELRQLFDKTFLASEEVSPTALIAPGPAEMMAAITQNTDALGYTLQSWVTSQVQTIPIDPGIQAALRQPILAVTLDSPSGFVRQYLACLQITEP